MEIQDMLKSGVNLAKVFPEKVEIADGAIILEKAPQKPQKWLKFNREKLYELGWPRNSGTFEVKDPASPVAVVCPAQNAELQAAALNYGAAISGPCVTPDRGVELLITNIISNPNIRWLILAGRDSGHLAGDVLYCLNKYGRDPKTKRVLETRCPTNPYLLNLSDEAIERFQKQVRVINLLGNYNNEKAEQIKIELGLIIRCCIQEPGSAIKLTYGKFGEQLYLFDFQKGSPEPRKTGDQFYLFDPGTEGLEPMIVDLSVEKIEAYYEGYHRVGTTIHIDTVAKAYSVLLSHIVNKGSWGKQESTRMALDTLATQTVVHNVKKDLFPTNWRPVKWIQTEEEAKDYLEKYRIWVYFFPLSDVKYDENKKVCVPSTPERMDYVYGGRLTAYWYELAEEKEKAEIKKLVEKAHNEFRYELPKFQDVVDFYEELAKLQTKSFNQLYATAKAAKLVVEQGFGNSYRLYMSLQTPPIDIKDDPRQSHNPCFALYEVYPRLIDGKWQLDVCFFLRAHDILAFPANANAGIMLQRFIAWYAGIKPGLYVHHAGSIEVCDYMLPKEILDKLSQKTKRF